jgi:hypothetical protein
MKLMNYSSGCLLFINSNTNNFALGLCWQDNKITTNTVQISSVLANNACIRENESVSFEIIDSHPISAINIKVKPLKPFKPNTDHFVLYLKEVLCKPKI